MKKLKQNLHISFGRFNPDMKGHPLLNIMLFTLKLLALSKKLPILIKKSLFFFLQISVKYSKQGSQFHHKMAFSKLSYDITYELTYITKLLYLYVFITCIKEFTPSQYLALYAKVRILFESRTLESQRPVN